MASETRPSTFHTYFSPKTYPFWGVHLAAIVGVAVVGLSWEGVLLAVASYYLRMFFVTAGYHRYFAHRTFKTSRAFQLVMAFFGGTASQKGALWWAAHHRVHHKFSDKPEDPHSPRLRGLAWAHVGWILSRDHDETLEAKIPDLMKYPELRFLDRYWAVPVLIYAATVFLVGGWEGLVWGFFVSTTLLWHGTFTINSLTHVWGRPRFPSDDESKNHWLLAIITMGEGWHNNHHYYQSTVKQGFYWWEYDFSYWILKVLSIFRIVWDLRMPPKRVLELGRRGRGVQDRGLAPTFDQLSLTGGDAE